MRPPIRKTCAARWRKPIGNSKGNTVEIVAVAVRSSATAEDLPNASFAGQHDSFLNIRGPRDLMEACRRCFASLFTDRAISYRIDNGFDHFKVALSVAVMKMVRSDLAASGVMFTLDTESGFRDVVFVTGAYGLGENIVQGAVDPDEFYVHKPTFKAGSAPCCRAGWAARRSGWSMPGAWRDHPQRRRRRRPTASGSASPTTTCCELAQSAIAVEKHYSEQGRHADADGYRVGEGRQRRRALHHPGAARRPWRPAASRRRSRATSSNRRARPSPPVAPSARRSRPARCA